MNDENKVILSEKEMPQKWCNILPFLPEPIKPYLSPQTMKPATPQELTVLFPMELIKQEFSSEEYIEIPDAISELYRIYRPSPLVRARRLEKALGTPARIYYKNESVSPAGSHKANTAIAQAYYNKQEGVNRLVTETGAGQWGSALALAGTSAGRHGDQGLHGAGLIQPKALPRRSHEDLGSDRRPFAERPNQHRPRAT